MKDIRKLPIIMCSMSNWDSPLSSAAFSLAKEFATTNQVFYFDYPYTLTDFYRKKNDPSVIKRQEAILRGQSIYTEVPEAGPNFKAVTPLMMLPFFSLPMGPLQDLAVKINNRRFFKTLRQVLKDHHIDRFIFFNSYNPFYGFQLPPDLRSNFYVYQSRDNLRATPGLEKHGPVYERKAARNADLVIATSGKLREIIAEETNRSVFLLPNAADISLFQKAVAERLPRPDDLPDNGRQLIGFIGNLGPRMDLELIDKCIKVHSDKNFVMIGPDNLSHYSGPAIRQNENLYLLGAKKPAELPAYLQYMDATMIPFLKDELTAGIYPLKLHEQLAAGKAIVSTDFSEDVKAFADVVYVADSPEAFVKKLGVAVKQNSKEQVAERVKRSDGNAWSDRVEQFWKLLEKLPNKNIGKGK